MEADEDPVVHDPMMAAMDHHHHHEDDDDPMMMHAPPPPPPHHHHHHEIDFFDRQPTREEMFEMKRASKRPSEWLKLLCKEWAEENLQLVESMDHKFIEYKPFLKGFITSQLLCRLCIPSPTTTYKRDHEGNPIATSSSNTDPPFDFWRMLNVEDEFDKAYIIAQVEKFCTLYQIRSDLDLMPASMMSVVPGSGSGTSPEAAAAAAAAAVAAANGHYLSPETTAAAVAAAQLAANKATASVAGNNSPILAAATAAGRHQVTATAAVTAVDAVTKAQRMAREAERALENERRQNVKREQKRQSHERKIEKQREREQNMLKKNAEKIAREASREEKRKKKIEMREQRERFAQQQKEAALKRAAELVASNRVPIEITRGAAAAKEAAQKALQQMGASTALISPSVEAPKPVATHQLPNDAASVPVPGPKKQRSAIVVSTASDLHQIVTHSKNLWAKYNAIAKEHNQKVNWITVAKELGIHVKVREKYARMHSRAEQRGFDWVAHGHWKIKDHPEIFVEPTQAEQKARMPPPPPDASRTVLISELDPAKPTLSPNSHQQEMPLQAQPSSYEYVPPPPIEESHNMVSSNSSDHHGLGTDAAAVAAAAAVVDATGVGNHVTTTNLDARPSGGTTSTTTSSAGESSYMTAAPPLHESNSGHGSITEQPSGVKEEKLTASDNMVVV